MILRRFEDRNGFSKLSSGLLASASTIVKKVVLYVISCLMIPQVNF